MPGAELTLVLARLLSDDAQRALWLSAPEEFCRQAGLSTAEQQALAGLDPLQIEAQAHSLLAKRYGEVCRTLPRSMARLGSQARPLFMRHARHYWPEGHRRHLLDALQFLEGLSAAQLAHCDPLEHCRLRFALGGRRLGLRLLRAGRPHSLPRVLLLFNSGRHRMRQWLI